MPQDESFAREFWQKMSLELSAVDLRAFLEAHSQPPPPLWVYVPVSIIRPWRRNALFVVLYGYRNPIDCASCTEIFLRTVDNNHEHIRFPFWACVSIKGFASGRFANCLWRQDKGTNPCTFRLHPERIPENALYEASPYLLTGSKASTWVIGPRTIPRASDPLTPSTCPIDPTPLWHGEDRAQPPLACPGLVLQDEHAGSDGEPVRDDGVVDGPPSPMPPKRARDYF
ncbi:hypothetical protein CEP54_015846 [Fusarium duplospermum]|uniref:Uncharacterized protein n=1 Tax=Fusarium duplospermum TaxID=1325734 RepID=A0A428NKM7_9HYPO|nr:hypothetical protein CEP54_015846 [Fusarium duplospermum]